MVPERVIYHWRNVWGWSNSRIAKKLIELERVAIQQNRPKPQCKLVTCEHKEAKHFALGMCEKCYKRQYHREYRKRKARKS